MKPKTIPSLIAGAFLLLGCAETGNYPISGKTVGANDQVRFLSAPGTAFY